MKHFTLISALFSLLILTGCSKSTTNSTEGYSVNPTFKIYEMYEAANFLTPEFTQLLPPEVEIKYSNLFCAPSDTASVTQTLREIQAETGLVPADAQLYWIPEPADENGDSRLYQLTITRGEPVITADDVALIELIDENNWGEQEVSITLNNEGAQLFAVTTRNNIGQCLGIVADDQMICCPKVNCEIPGGKISLTQNGYMGDFSNLVNKTSAGQTAK